MQRRAWTVLAAILFWLGTTEISGAQSQQQRLAAGLFQAAERGSPKEQARLGIMYENGIGVPQDYYLAAKWYHRAAEQGEPHAQHHLGILLNKGFGVGVDFIEAYKWLNLAAARVRTVDRDYYARMRDAVASKLTYSELAEGQRRASYWRPLPSVLGRAYPAFSK